MPAVDQRKMQVPVFTNQRSRSGRARRNGRTHFASFLALAVERCREGIVDTKWHFAGELLGGSVKVCGGEVCR